MFERYRDNARRVLFYARYEAAQMGGLTIEPEHLVLGVLGDDPQAVLRFARAGEYLSGASKEPQEPGTVQSIRTRLPGYVADVSVVRQWTGVVKPGLAGE